MIGKRKLIASVMLVVLAVFGVLNLDTVRLSAYESPAIYISPPTVRTSDPGPAMGTEYTFTVRTDYGGSDIWGFEFGLTFNPDVLEGVEVLNGSSIINVGVGPVQWNNGTFCNTVGNLTGVASSFSSVPPQVTNGPGILANITFKVVGYGYSNIAFVEGATRLIGAYEVGGGEWTQYIIIDDSDWGHIEGSVFYNVILGDINGDRVVDSTDDGMFGVAWGSIIGQPLYNPNVDLNSDTVIDSTDDGIFGVHWGELYIP